MRKSAFFLILLAVTVACGKKNSFTVKGILENPDQSHITISRIDINTPVFVDSAAIKKNGSFSLRIKASEADFYQVGYSDDFITLLAAPGERINLHFRGKQLFSAYEVTGSEGSEKVRLLDLKLIRTKNSLDSINNLYLKASEQPGFDTTGTRLAQLYTDLMLEQRSNNIRFIIENTKSLAAIKAVYQRLNDTTYVLFQNRDLQYLKILSDSLGKYYPASRHTKALISDFEKEYNQFQSNQLGRMADELPETVLDPDLKDVNGRRIKLSSLRGKYVLLSFWTLSSRECIAENLQFKDFYRTYNRNGFEIYQVNLDADEEAWKSAVRFDELPWINVREDDPANPVNARLYNVRVLPANYLYDPSGNIIATNLHGRALQIKLSQLFTN